MLVFGSLKRRKLQQKSQKQCVRRCYGCVIYSSPWCAVGLLCPQHTFQGRVIYTYSVSIFFARLLFLAIPTATTTNDAKVQIPTFFVLQVYLNNNSVTKSDSGCLADEKKVISLCRSNYHQIYFKFNPNIQKLQLPTLQQIEIMVTLIYQKMY